MKKIEELNDDEIARVRAQQAPCHFGNCTQKEYAAIEWPDVDDKHPLIWVGGMPRSGKIDFCYFLGVTLDKITKRSLFKRLLV